MHFQTETHQSTVLLWFMPFAANTDCVGKNPHFRPNLSLNPFFEVEVATEHKAMGPLKSNVVPCGAAHSCREGPTVWTIGPSDQQVWAELLGAHPTPLPCFKLRFKTCSVVSGPLWVRVGELWVYGGRENPHLSQMGVQHFYPLGQLYGFSMGMATGDWPVKTPTGARWGNTQKSATFL